MITMRNKNSTDAVRITSNPGELVHAAIVTLYDKPGCEEIQILHHLTTFYNIKEAKAWAKEVLKKIKLWRVMHSERSLNDFAHFNPTAEDQEVFKNFKEVTKQLTMDYDVFPNGPFDINYEKTAYPDLLEALIDFTIAIWGDERLPLAMRKELGAFYRNGVCGEIYKLKKQLSEGVKCKKARAGK